MENEIQELVDKLNYYTKLYDEGRPTISDKEYDDMYFQLQKLENETGIYLQDSPTQKINYQVVNQLNKVKHNHLMLSLDKTKSIDDIEAFVGNKEYIAMAKMDGLTASLHYLNGKLVSAETRGNGIEGEDILHNALVVKNLPKKIDFQDELIVDGEIICTYEDFKPFEKEYKNPRNFASGSIRLLSNKESVSRNLTFIAWDCIKGLELNSLHDKLVALKYNFNFKIVPYICGNKDSDIEEEINYIKDNCFNYPIDGIVFKYDNCEEYAAAGKTDHHYRGGLAYKFYDEEYETTLRDIEFTMGKTGKLTPVAIFDAVAADGTEISRANIHNLSVMKEILGKPYKGQKIWVIKSNEIIPQLTKAEIEIDKTKVHDYIEIPTICPICGEATEIIKEVDSEVLYCGNPSCQGKLLNRIENFFSKRSGLNAKGLSKATIGKLIDFNWVERISDMFTLSKYENEWKNKNGFGEKSVRNILQAISECTNCDLESVISAAGIPLIGRSIAREISARFSTYNSFREAVRGNFDFSEIKGFGYEMNKSLKSFDYTELDYIVENYLHIKKEETDKENKENNLNGLTFVITGALKEFKNRDELSNLIQSLGGKVTGSVSKNTNYLINNDLESTSSKNKKAKELGIAIINEATLLSMLDYQK